MEISIRKLNAFANIQKTIGHKDLAKMLHEQVLMAIESGISEIDMSMETEQERKLVQLVLQAESYIPILNKQIKKLAEKVQ